MNKNTELNYQNLPENHFIVHGMSAVSEFVKNRPNSLVSIVVKDLDHALKPIKKLPNYNKVSNLIRKRSPQVNVKGQTFAVVHLRVTEEDDFFVAIKSERPPLVLALSGITDSGNLGAICRTAAFYGVEYIITQKDRQVGLTAASVTASAGSFAYSQLVQVTNLRRTLEKLKSETYWILGTDLQGESLDGAQVDFENKVLVMGAEDKGIPRLIRDNCDVLVKESGAGRGPQSLNVSVACGVFLSHLKPTL